MKTFSVGAAEFGAWANTATADQNTVVLNAGESRDVTLTFDVKKSVSGAQTFFIEALSGTDVTRQPVAVTIAPSTGFGATLSNVFSGGSWPVWLIGVLNVLLVVVIVVVAVRIARK